MSAHEKNAVKKPKSATATWKHSGPTSSTSQSASVENALNLDQLKREGYFSIFYIFRYSTQTFKID